MFTDKARGYFIDRIKGRNKVNTSKFYVDIDRDNGLKDRVASIPSFKCPNPDCSVYPDIDYSKLDKSTIIEIKKPDTIYLEHEKLYYCPKCERSYPYDPNSIGFDDEGIDVSQSTDNPVNEGLKSNSIIRSFGHIKPKGNKVNNDNYAQIEKRVKEQYKQQQSSRTTRRD